MWLYTAALITGSLLILVASDFQQAIAQAARFTYSSQATSTVKLSKDCGKFYHRGSGRRETFRQMHSMLA
jgi:hypothetical protein